MEITQHERAFWAVRHYDLQHGGITKDEAKPILMSHLPYEEAKAVWLSYPTTVAAIEESVERARSLDGTLTQALTILRVVIDDNNPGNLSAFYGCIPDKEIQGMAWKSLSEDERRSLFPLVKRYKNGDT